MDPTRVVSSAPKLRGRAELSGLPVEILLCISDHLDLLDLTPFLKAIHTILESHGMAPSAVAQSMLPMKLNTSKGKPAEQAKRPPRGVGIQNLPPELRLHLGKHLTTMDKVNFAIAWGHGRS